MYNIKLNTCCFIEVLNAINNITEAMEMFKRFRISEFSKKYIETVFKDAPNRLAKKILINFVLFFVELCINLIKQKLISIF